MTRKSTISFRRFTLQAALLLFVVFGAFASDNLPHEVISKEKAVEDIKFYFTLIDQQHGNPYEYISRDEFKNLVSQKIEALPETITNQNFSAILLELNQNIRCGHTSISPDAGLIKRASELANFFPYPISIIDNQVYVDFEDGDLPHASKIRSINGLSSANILSELTALTITDGFIETKKKRELESRFGYYFYMKYGPSANFEVEYSSENTVSTATITGTTGNTMLANNYYRPLYKSHERYYHFTHLDAVDSLNTLILTLNTFQANPEWFYERIASRYDKASKTFDFDNLVLDLRGNEGGDRRLLNILYQIIGGKDLNDPSKTSIQTSNIIGTDQLLGINGSFNSKEVLLHAETYLKKHFTHAQGDDLASDVQNWHEEFKLDFDMDDIRFRGNVYVLISGKTFSAAADLARILSPLPNVTLVGEETGGAHIGRTANMLLNYALPNSKLTIQVPVIYEEFINTTENAGLGRGTFPDYQIAQTFEDLQNKRDAAFDFTVDLILENSILGSN